MKEKKFVYVAPKVHVVQVKMRSSMLAGSFTESMSGAEPLGDGGSFGARESQFSDWDDFEE